MPPKALLVENEAKPVVKQAQKNRIGVRPENAASTPEPALPDDDIKMPDMLALPSEGEFRQSAGQGLKVTGEPGAIIARPPTDPPSRVKPTATEPE